MNIPGVENRSHDDSKCNGNTCGMTDVSSILHVKMCNSVLLSTIPCLTNRMITCVSNSPFLLDGLEDESMPPSEQSLF